MRVQIEKCDKIKGVQVFTEEESFFSGICSSSLELFRDHFSRSVPIFTLSLSSSPVRYFLFLYFIFIYYYFNLF